MKIAMLVAAVLLASAPLLPTPARAQGALSGEVLEIQNVEGYSYLRLKTAAGETWAAVTTANVKKGDKVSIANPMTMKNFESKALQKRFDSIVFGEVAPTGSMAAAPMTGLPGATTTPHPNVAAVPAAPIKVDKAKGPEGKTVAQVMKGKTTLKDKTVLVRGKVVKVNSGIKGKNWLHLQDGTGSAQDGSNDLIVTTTEVAAVGDVVTARGTVRTDVTVGPGYAYEVLVENAKLGK